MKATSTVIFDREEYGRIIASVPGVPGCHAYGKTQSEAVRRVKSTLTFYLQELLRQGKKPPKQATPVTVEIQLAV